MKGEMEVKKNELENEGFFSHGGNRARKRLRMVARSLVDAVLVKWFDDWQAVLQLCALLFFFGFALPMGITYLGVWHGAIYAYAYIFLCVGVSSLLAYREVLRRDKTMIGGEWTTNPNAINEYIELVKKHKS